MADDKSTSEIKDARERSRVSSERATSALTEMDRLSQVSEDSRKADDERRGADDDRRAADDKRRGADDERRAADDKRREPTP